MRIAQRFGWIPSPEKVSFAFVINVIMIKIDAHHHLWKYSPRTHDWIDDDMRELKRDFMPEDLYREMKRSDYDGCVAVQASQTEGETRFLLEQAKKHPFIKGVVGWLDLRSPQLKEKLVYYSNFSKLKGLRHVIQDEPDDQFMLRDDFLSGIAMLQQFGLTWDILIFPKHLKTAEKLVAMFPGQKFVLDHIAKPDIAENILSPWREDMYRLAELPNVHCKISGLVTEAKWKFWKPEEFIPYLEVIYDAFGAERLMIGSDWPVCLLSGSYREVMQIAENYLGNYPRVNRILGRNAIDFYNLEVG